MKNIILLLSLLFSTSLLGQSNSLQVLTSEVNWKGKAAFNAYSLAGTLHLKESKLILEGTSLSTAAITLDMKTIASDNKQLVKHLKSKDFFEVKRFPEATFSLSQAISWAEGEQMAEGILTVKSTSLPISIPLVITKKGEHWLMTGKVMIDRTKYGIKFNSPTYFEQLKEQAIADEFELAFALELTAAGQVEVER